jgi:squalene-associated FAD-dependent desaturase
LAHLGVLLNAMRVAIIGGGWAGLAAAVTLAEQQVPVTLFESAAQLGGRARRVSLNGLSLDNGQHILIGAYRETLRLLQRVGIQPEQACFAPPLTLQVAPGFRLQAASLPAPWHLGLGLLRGQGISPREKFSAMRFLQALKRMQFRVDAQLSVASLLTRHGQSARLNDYLWKPLCLAALNTAPDQASAQIFINVLRDAFFARRDDSRLLLPRINLGALFPDAAANYLRAHGATLSLNQRIQGIARQDGGYTLQHAQGTAHFTQVICAIPPFRVPQIFAQIPAMQPIVSALAAWRYQPIYTVYLQYDADVRLPFPMLGLSQCMSQWVFDRGLTGQPGLLAVVISAQGPHEALSHDELVRQVRTDLRQVLNVSATPRWTQVIAEKRATFSCTPNLQRPQNQTPLPGLYLAGDYTASDYPATLESAMRSGVASARLALG